ncbi:MAG: RsmE family RNA methyltransferase [Actinomycetota bacterium]
MTAPHFFAADVTGERVVLERDDSRHALRVLRLRPGEQITVSDGRGSVVEATVGDDDDHLVAHVTDRRSEPEPRPALHVYQALPKAGKLDLVVQKLTELGVSSINLFASRRSVPRWDAAKAASHTARLGEVARQAAMQSRRAWLPRVLPPSPLSSLAMAEPLLVLHGSATTRLSDALPETWPSAFGLVVGPEGGLTEEEVTALRALGAIPVTMGPLILRTETAALAAAAIVLGRYGQLG